MTWVKGRNGRKTICPDCGNEILQDEAHRSELEMEHEGRQLPDDTYCTKLLDGDY